MLLRRARTRTTSPQKQITNEIQKGIQKDISDPKGQLSGIKKNQKRDQRITTEDSPSEFTSSLKKKTFSSPSSKLPSRSSTKSYSKEQKNDTDPYDHLIAQAKEAHAQGDYISSERFYQQADHHLRQRKKDNDSF